MGENNSIYNYIHVINNEKYVCFKKNSIFLRHNVIPHINFANIKYVKIVGIFDECEIHVPFLKPNECGVLEIKHVCINDSQAINHLLSIYQIRNKKIDFILEDS